jgi:valyl-tRNA synthetase
MVLNFIIVTKNVSMSCIGQTEAEFTLPANKIAQMSTDMKKTYDPHTIESYWIDYWQSKGFGKATDDTQKPIFSMMLPPPNVTGHLHMGHAFQQSLMDALARYYSMRGYNVLWQPGTDHAGIATQMVVERQLLAHNVSRHDLGREAFLEKVWEWKTLSGSQITTQMRRLGILVDWSRERFSMDEDISSATLHAFVKLYRDGLIYRGKRLVNWDPVLKTAISDLEVITKEEPSSLWYIRYPTAQTDEYVVVATTRPETLFGDTAIAVHPQDNRYQHLIGQMVTIPVAQRKIPVIADESIDPTFGTGCVKVTPAHDFNDYDIGIAHQLPMINIFNDDATLNKNVPIDYQGMDRYVAREKIITALTQKSLMKEIESHTISIPRGDRSGVIIEPMLTNQWFIKVESLAKKAIAVVDNQQLHFIPKNWTKTYRNWLENIHDWCISRQLWWGHRIPAWYDEQNQIYVGYDEADVRRKYQLGDTIKLTQDTDVLDTWFTAALWPFSSLNWPSETSFLKLFYPSSVLVTGFDIIFFWVARMVMLGLYFLKDVPFESVYITGLIRDAHGQKMSKTKGNVLDPIDLIDGITLEQLIKKRTSHLMQPEMAAKIRQATTTEFPKGIPSFGTDALRFTLCALANTGRNINFDIQRTEGYRHFCNKLWNAARFVLMHTQDGLLLSTQQNKNIITQWIYHVLKQTIDEVNKAFQSYRFDRIARLLYDFVWHEYCDWYLELAKVILNDPKTPIDEKHSLRYALAHVLEITLRLLHPIIPFITEEIWQKIKTPLKLQGDSIFSQPYPKPNDKNSNDSANQQIHWLKKFIITIRTVRSEINLPPNKPLKVILNKGSSTDKEYIKQNEKLIKALAHIETLSWLVDHPSLPLATTQLMGELEIYIILEDLIDPTTELKRLEKNIQKIEKTLHQSKQKLNNKQYLAKAPATVIEKEQKKFKELFEQKQKMQNTKRLFEKIKPY